MSPTTAPTIPIANAPALLEQSALAPPLKVRCSVVFIPEHDDTPRPATRMIGRAKLFITASERYGK